MTDDITKCGDEECPMKRTCLRWMIPAKKHLQYYFSLSPRKETTCSLYLREKDKGRDEALEEETV